MQLVWLGYIFLQFVLSTLATIPKEWWTVGYTSEESAYSVDLPRWLGTHGNFDGLHYMAISKDAYEIYRHAFFPLYPSLMHLVTFVTPGGRYFAGLLISLLCLGILLHIWNKLYLLLDGKKNHHRDQWSCAEAFHLQPKRYTTVCTRQASVAGLRGLDSHRHSIRQGFDPQTLQ